MNESSPKKAKPSMNLMDVFKSGEKTIPGIVEQTGPSYDFLGWIRRESVQSYVLSVDDEQSWQHFIDISGTAEYGYDHAGSKFSSFAAKYDFLWIGESLLITRQRIVSDEPDLEVVASVRCYSDHVHLYAKKDILNEADSNENYERVVNLLTLVLPLLSGEAEQSPRFDVHDHHRDIEFLDSTGMKWIKRTNGRYNTIRVREESQQEWTMSTDDIFWLTAHTMRLIFNACVFDEVLINALCDGIANGCSMLHDLSLTFSDDDKDAMVVQSMTHFFRQQIPCSLVTLRLEVHQTNAPILVDFFDALSQYPGNIKHVLVKVGVDSMPWATWIEWIEVLMTSKTITEYIVHYVGKLQYSGFDDQTLTRLRAALDRNENIQALMMLYGDNCLRCERSFEAFAPSFAYRRVKKKWIKLNAMDCRVVDGGQVATMQSMDTPTALHYSLY